MISKEQINNLFNEQGHLTDEGTAFYAEALVKEDTDSLPEKVLQHVMDCPECKMSCLELAGILKLRPDAGMMEGENAQADKEHQNRLADRDRGGQGHKRNMNFWAFTAAALAIIMIGIGWLIIHRQKKMKEEERMVQNNTRVKTDSIFHNDTLADVQTWIDMWCWKMPGKSTSFEENNTLEAMLKLIFRSPDFIMKEPDTIAECSTGSPLLFYWESTKDQEITLRIMDNKGQVVHQRRLKHHLYYEVNKILEPGLYYWFIEQSHLTVAGGRLGVVKDQ